MNRISDVHNGIKAVSFRSSKSDVHTKQKKKEKIWKTIVKVVSFIRGRFLVE